MISGARYWISSAIPIGSRWIETKYSHWTRATPATPKTAMYRSSPRPIRNVRGRATARKRAKPTKAPIDRACVRSTVDRPAESRTTLETVPLTAKMSAAVQTIA
jgi:hypothetical protein